MIKLKKSASKPNMKLYSKKGINLIPKTYEKEKKKRSYGFLIVMLAIVLVALAGFKYYDLRVELSKINQENDIVVKKLQIRIEEKNRLQILYALKSRVEEKVNVLKAIQNAHASVTTVSRYIESSLPKDIVYANLEFDAVNGIHISGRTKNKEEIPDFLHRVKKLDRFSDVVIDSITRVEGTLTSEDKYGVSTNKNTIVYYDFVFVCKLGGDDNEADRS